MGDGWGWWMVFGRPVMIAFWGFFIWGISVLVRQVGLGAGQRHADESTALEILERRYARGEIDAHQFEDMRVRLTGRGESRAKSA
jgi:putative membrane protein